MLWILIVLLVLLWVGGFSLAIGGSFIHLLLAIALIVLIYNLLVGRNSAP